MKSSALPPAALPVKPRALHHPRHAIAGGLLAAAAGLMAAWPQTAPAQIAPGAAERRFDIELAAQPLAQALSAVSRTTGVPVFAAGELVGGRTAPAIKGRYSVAEALQRLLVGSGIEALPQPGGGYALQRAAAGTAAPAAALQETRLPTITVSARAERKTTTEGSRSYAPQATGAATGLALSLRETPQSVTVITRQRIEDQGATELAEVFRMTPGLSFDQSGSQGSDVNAVYSRGFAVENYQVDGVAQLNSWLLQTSDLAIYDRVEVLRGATGLLNGVGTPAATINMVRKRPTRAFQGGATVSAASWDAYRADLDVSSPLDAQGNFRGRVVAAVEDKSSYIDRAQEGKKILYGIVEADLTAATKLTAGLEYQKHDADGVGRSGLPLFYDDGTPANFSRSQSGGATWGRSYQTHRAAFVEAEHQFDSEWVLRANVGQTRRKYDDVIGYVFGGRPTWPMPDGTGYAVAANKWDAEYVQDAVDLRASGPVGAFGRSHDLVVGLNVSRSTYDAPWYDAWKVLPIANFNTWNGSDPAEPTFVVTGMTTFEEKQSGAYATLRLRPTDALSLLVGARVSRWEQTTVDTPAGGPGTTTTRREDDVVTPYAGVVYDLSRAWSVYASATDIFKPQNNKTVTGSYLDPMTGTNVEGGVKAAWLDGRLNFSVALFRVQQDNLAVMLPGELAPDGWPAYTAAKGAKTTGYEIELAGEPARGWNVATGFTHRRSNDEAGMPLNTEAPRNQFKLFTTYAPAAVQGLTVGGGVSWQSEIHADAGPQGERYTQASYSVVDLMARYALNPRLTVAATLNNALDEKYTTSPWYSYYGAPRNVKLTLAYKF